MPHAGALPAINAKRSFVHGFNRSLIEDLPNFNDIQSNNLSAIEVVEMKGQSKNVSDQVDEMGVDQVEQEDNDKS